MVGPQMCASWQIRYTKKAEIVFKYFNIIGFMWADVGRNLYYKNKQFLIYVQFYNIKRTVICNKHMTVLQNSDFEGLATYFLVKLK